MSKTNFLRIVFLAWPLLHFATEGYSATVTSIKPDKKQVIIDEGKENEIKKGEKVCFFNKKNKKVACGKISKVKKGSSIATVKKHLDKVEEGFTAKIDGHGEGDKSSKSGGGRDPYTFALRFYFPISLLSSTTHKEIFYDPPSRQATVPPSVDTLWSADPHPTSPLFLLAFGGEAEYAPLKLRLGFRYKQYSPILLEGDYLPSGPSYTQTSITGSAIGGYLDFFFLKFSIVKIGVGLDADISGLTLATVKIDETGAEQPLISASSKATVFSLRIPICINVPLFSKIGITLGLTPSIPLMASASPLTLTAELDDAANAAKLSSQDPALDLQTSLAHTKNSFGLEVISGIYFGF